MVSAFDVRPAVAEQVASLGAAFLDLGVHGEETEGGYARELTPEQQQAQQDALAARIPEFDVVVATAAVPGRPAPTLIAAAVVGEMRPGSVIVDLAAETGGNCELTEPGREIEHGGVRIVGLTNVASLMPADASRLYARNVSALLQHLAPEAGARARLLGRDHRGGLRHPTRRGGGRMTDLGLVIELTILVLAIFLGFEVISKVPTMLHTPLMSGTNFIHGIVIVGAIVVLGYADDTFTKAIGFVAMVLATANVVGGWFVTDRMLEMFKRRPDERRNEPS